MRGQTGAQLSLVEEMHAARKARLARMSEPLDQTKIVEGKLATAQATIVELEDLIAHQRRIIRSFTGAAPTIDDVMVVVSKHYKIPAYVMSGPGRSPSAVAPRGVAFLLCRRFGYSLTQIGEAFNKRNHTTIYHGAWKASLDAEADSELGELLKSLEAKVAERAAARVTAALEAVS